MRIKKIQLKNFKRFTDLTIENIPEEAKLVLLIGSNGSGKSSIFDAFGFLGNKRRQLIPSDYFFKNNNPSSIDVQFVNEGRIQMQGLDLVGDYAQ